jgi:hypothetical protein
MCGRLAHQSDVFSSTKDARILAPSIIFVPCHIMCRPLLVVSFEGLFNFARAALRCKRTPSLDVTADLISESTGALEPWCPSSVSALKGIFIGVGGRVSVGLKIRMAVSVIFPGVCFPFRRLLSIIGMGESYMVRCLVRRLLTTHR